MTKVLRLTPHFYFNTSSWPAEYDPIGGMQSQIYELVEKLDENGYSQDVVTFGLPGIPRKLDMFSNSNVYSVRFTDYNIKSKKDGQLLLNEHWLVGTLLFILRDVFYRRKKYDLIHLHYSGVLAVILATFIVKLFFWNKDIFITVHCSRKKTYKPFGLVDRIFNSLSVKLEEMSLMLCTRVFFLNTESLESYKQNQKNFVVIKDFLQNIHQEHSAESCNSCSLVKNDQAMNGRILFVGRFSHEKGWDLFIDLAYEIIKEDPSQKFLMVGDGPQFGKAEEMINRLGLTEYVVLKGFISKNEVPCVLAQNKLLVIPSRHEEFGGICLEAVAARIKIVAFNVGQISKILKNYSSSIVVENHDKTLLSKATMTLLNDRRKISSDSSIDEILKGYNRDDVVKTYMESYD